MNATLKPRLIHPVDGAKIDARAATFRWQSSASRAAHELLIASDDGFSDVLFSVDLNGADELTIYNTFNPAPGTFYWRIRARTGDSVQESPPAAFEFGSEVDAAAPPELQEADAVVHRETAIDPELTTALQAWGVVGVMAFGLLLMVLLLFLPVL